MIDGKWIALTALLALGCGGEETTEETPETEAQPQDEGPPGPVVTDPSFELRAEAPGPYTTGTAGELSIRLVPRGRYHVNQDYPMTVSVTAPAGLEVPDRELEREQAAEYTEQRARFAVPFTPRATGQHQVSARVNFAVCTPEACMPEERTLALVVPVE